MKKLLLMIIAAGLSLTGCVQEQVSEQEHLNQKAARAANTLRIFAIQKRMVIGDIKQDDHNFHQLEKYLEEIDARDLTTTYSFIENVDITKGKEGVLVEAETQGDKNSKTGFAYLPVN